MILPKGVSSNFKNYYVSLRGDLSRVGEVFEKINVEFYNYLKDKADDELYYVVPGSNRNSNLNFEKNDYRHFEFNKFKNFSPFFMESHLKTTYESRGFNEFNNKEITSRLELNLFGEKTDELDIFCNLLKKIDKSVKLKILKPFF